MITLHLTFKAASCLEFKHFWYWIWKETLGKITENIQGTGKLMLLISGKPTLFSLDLLQQVEHGKIDFYIASMNWILPKSHTGHCLFCFWKTLVSFTKGFLFSLLQLLTLCTKLLLSEGRKNGFLPNSFLVFALSNIFKYLKTLFSNRNLDFLLEFCFCKVYGFKSVSVHWAVRRKA